MKESVSQLASKGSLATVKGLVVAFLLINCAGYLVAAGPTSAGKSGEKIYLEVDYYPDEKSQNDGIGKLIKADYKEAKLYVDLEFIGIETIGPKEVACQRVEITIKKRTPHVPGSFKYTIFIDPDTGWPRRTNERNIELQYLTDNTKTAFVISPNVSHLPLEFFPPFGTGEKRLEGKLLDLKLAWPKDAEFHYTAAYFKDRQKNDILIRQKWRPGRKWWNEFVRYVNGRKNLVARVIPELPAEITKKQAKAETKTFSFPLRLDRRLTAAVPITDPRPKFDALLLQLCAATGLKIMVSDSLSKHDPYIGYMQTDPKDGWKAWEIMELLERRGIENGKWQKTAVGYVLHGKPKVLISPEAEKEQTAKKKAFEAAAAKTAADFAKFHPLWLDPKLRAPLTLVEKTPKLPSLLEGLRACTGLDFTLADNLTYHDPVIGHFQSKHTFAYIIMEIIAKRELDDGGWEKTDTGYRLEGTSKALRPPPPGFPWGRVAWGLAGLAVFGGLIFLGRRWQPAKKEAAP